MVAWLWLRELYGRCDEERILEWPRFPEIDTPLHCKQRYSAVHLRLRVLQIGLVRVEEFMAYQAT